MKLERELDVFSDSWGGGEKSVTPFKLFEKRRRFGRGGQDLEEGKWGKRISNNNKRVWIRGLY